MNPKKYANKAEYETEILGILKEKGVELICLKWVYALYWSGFVGGVSDANY